MSKQNQLISGVALVLCLSACSQGNEAMRHSMQEPEASIATQLADTSSQTENVAQIPPAKKQVKQRQLKQVADANTKAETLAIDREQVLAAARQIKEWQPNEGQLLRGRELLLGLAQELGHKPSALESQLRLQTHLGLAPDQSVILARTLQGNS